MNNEGDIKPFKSQKWEELKGKYNRKNLFQDPLFPPTAKSLYSSKSGPKDVVWKRPTQARTNPQFVVDGYNRCDLDQGFLGNCWFIAGCVGIMQNEKCFAKVVPPDQNFGESYGGIFHFRFWLYGQWFDVVIDDMLPFWPDGKLVFCSNKQSPDEFWGALLEKAYAKVFGAYENLDGGLTTDALIDMSGGIEEYFEIQSLLPLQKKNFWTTLYQGFKKSSIIACSMEADESVREAVQSNGLIKGHAYTIVDMTEFETNGTLVRLLQLRNPWGDEREWTGAWSDKSKEWRSVSDEIKRKIKFKIESDGEFWMSFDDFIRSWDSVQICHLSLESFSEEVLKQDDDSDLSWNLTSYSSEWKVPSTSGGNGSVNQKKYWTNPQFLVTLEDVDKNDNENMATVIIALMQQDSRLRKIHIENDVKQILPIQNNVRVQEEEIEEEDYEGQQGEEYYETPQVEEYYETPQGEEYYETPQVEEYYEEEPLEGEYEDFVKRNVNFIMAKGNNSNGPTNEQADEFIQFRLYRVRDDVKVDANVTSGLRFYSNQLIEAGDTGTYLNRREITQRFRVSPGNYVIIPSTFDEDKNCKFLLRIYTEVPIKAKKLTNHKQNLTENEIKKVEKVSVANEVDLKKIIKPTPVPAPTPAAPNKNRNVVEQNEPEEACAVM